MFQGRRLAVALALAASVVGLLVWQLAAGGARAPSEPDAVAPGAAGAGPRAESREGASAPAIVPKRFLAPEGDPEGASSATRAAEGRHLRVVLVPGDVPAVGAVVDITSMGPVGNSRGYTTRDLVADGEGLVRLPPFDGCAEARGTLGKSSGRAVLSGEKLVFDLRLAPAIGVLVVDTAGEAQPSVPVLVRREGYAPTDRTETGADGTAWLASPASLPAQNKSTKAFVALAIPLEEAVEAPLDLASPPDAPIRLVIPAVGRVVVRLVTSDLVPFTGEATVILQSADKGLLRVTDESPDAVIAAATRGVATFACVGAAGRKLQAIAIPSDLALRRISGTVEGPRPGSEASLTLECGGIATVITGRFVNGERKPRGPTLADIKLPIFGGAAAAEPYTPDVTVVAGTDGRFSARFDVDPTTVGRGEAQIAVRSHPPLTGGVWIDRTQEITAAIPERTRSGTADIGDIVVPDLAFVAEGKVVSDRGAPIDRATVRLMRRAPSGWERTGDLDDQAVTGTDGRFELEGEAEGPSLGVSAERDGWICLEATPIKIGARDVTVTMVEAGAIEGSISGLERGSSRVWTESPIEVSIMKAGSEAPRKRGFGREAGADPDRREIRVYHGKFKSGSLLPGTYTVELYPSADWGENPKPLLVVEGVTVKAGETTRDPRLQGIDLAKLLKARTVTVLDERGRPLEGVRVGARTAGTLGKFGVFVTNAAGKATVVSEAATLDLVAARKGFRAASVSKVTGDATITVEKAAPKRVVVRLAEGAELPAPPFSIGVSLEFLALAGETPPDGPASFDPRNAESPEIFFGRDRTAVLEVDTPGVYVVELLLWKESSRGRSGSHLSDSDARPPIVTVGEDGASITVSIDPAQLKKAMEQDQ